MRFKLVFIFLIYSVLIGAQNGKDSYAYAESLLYEKPDQTIKISKDLLKKETAPDQIAHLNLLISNAYTVKRNSDSSLYYILKTKELVNTPIQINTKAKILNYIAIQYQQMELYDKALEALDQSSEFSEKLPKEDYYRNYFSAINNSVRGMIYKSQSNTEMAIAKLKLAEEEFKLVKSNKMTSGNISIVLYNIGYCYLDLNQPEQSKSYFQQSVEYAKDSKQSVLQAFSLKGLADYFANVQNYQESNRLLTEAEQLSKDSKDLTLKSGIYKLMSHNYLELNDWSPFQDFLTKYQEIDRQKSEIEERSLNRFSENQDAEYQEKVKVLKRNDLIFKLFVMGFSVILSGLLFQYYRKTKANNLKKIAKFKELFK